MIDLLFWSYVMFGVGVGMFIGGTYLAAREHHQANLRVIRGRYSR